MMTLRRQAITTIATGILAVSCTSISSPRTSLPIDHADRQALAEENCSRNGGNWVLRGLGGHYFCEVPTFDSSQACTDSSQCQGVCLAPEGIPIASRDIVGQCSALERPGKCENFLLGGVVRRGCIP